MSEENKLFSEFPPVSTQEWEDVIKRDLKGAPYEKKLIWRTIEGLNFRPYYRNEDLENIPFVQSMPGSFPYVRGYHKTDNNWDIRQDIIVDNLQEANKKALSILEKGVNSLGFDFTYKPIDNQQDFDKLLKGLYLSAIKINFIAGRDSVDYLTMFTNYAEKIGIDRQKLYGSVDFDPIRHLNLTGNFYYNSIEKAFDRVERVVNFVSEKLPNFKAITVNAQYYRNSGASVVQELGFALAAANEYLNAYVERGNEPDKLLRHIQFSFAVGSSYFLEISKLRAFRMLWANLVKEYTDNYKELSKTYIHSITADWNKTVYDPYVNMLRTTTEAMSAILGGTNSLTINPFDKYFQKTSEFSERIARNQQIILKEESYFDRIADPAAGSYYIENITNSIAETAWNLFLEIEDKGGYINAFEKEYIQDLIEETANKRNHNIASRREILLGTNQYPNFTEKIKENIDFEVYYNQNKYKEAEVKLGRPLRPYRGAQEFEELRLKTEKSGKTPKVFMITYGNLAMRKARATFSCNFFACAGFEVIDNNGFDTPQDGINAFEEANADIAVICSSDDEYADIVPIIYEKLKNKAIVVVAGNPACADDLRKIGVQHFIHIKSNVLEELKKFQNLLNIN